MKNKMIAVPTLNVEQEQKVKTLISTCQAFDKMNAQTYLSNQYNDDLTMPASFLSFKENQLVGYLKLDTYETDGEADITAFVDPSVRKQGIFTQLDRLAREQANLHHCPKIYYKTEKVFVDAHPEMFAKWKLDEETFDLYHEHDVLSSPSEVFVDLIAENEIMTFAKILADSFEGGNIESYEKSIRVTRANPYGKVFVIKKEQQVIGGSLYDSEDIGYLFTLAVAEAYRGRGYATSAVIQMVTEIKRLNDLPIGIGVLRENQTARHVYERAGFVTKTWIQYYER